ncbi:MAG: DUF1071 domain-containing protein [Cyanobacteria bacterium]|nr:DUF1071 domain-containing protein [Cyanobacteria bacterium GSL.Bin21]
MDPTIASKTIEPPTTPGEWTLSQIEQALSRPLPPSLLRTKTLKGNPISYIPWYVCSRILSKYAVGWRWELTHLQTTPERIFLVGRLTIPTRDGEIAREATGTEELSTSSYGDPSSNAESMAFRRAAARFGLGLSLYEKS